ncbi:MAG: UDP-N-acetylmuramate dehydrogenase [Lachnospiraceae bacterium]
MEQMFYEKLIRIIPEKRVLRDEVMKKHTTFRVGGPADFFVMPGSREELRDITVLCKSEGMPYYIMGNGSNLLVSDRGYRGVIIQIYREMSMITVDENQITAGAGALLSKIAGSALEAGLTGFEFAAGIPGTLGGACMMNAGAYGGEMKDVLKEVTVLTPEGEFTVIPAGELDMGYRTSVIEKKGYVVLEAVIALEKGEHESIRKRMEELREKRVSKQPLEYPSAGSTFKRPEGYFAGKLIEDAGLRGYRTGGAQVSEKHCGFVINTGNAEAKDIMELMKQVSERVMEKSGVLLEPEVRRLGDF